MKLSDTLWIKSVLLLIYVDSSHDWIGAMGRVVGVSFLIYSTILALKDK